MLAGKACVSGSRHGIRDVLIATQLKCMVTRPTVAEVRAFCHCGRRSSTGKSVFIQESVFDGFDNGLICSKGFS